MKTFEDARARLTGARLDAYDALTRYGPRTAPDLAALMRADPAATAATVAELREIGFARPNGRTKGAELVFEALTMAKAQEAFAKRNEPQDVRGPALWIPAPRKATEGEQIALL